MYSNNVENYSNNKIASKLYSVIQIKLCLNNTKLWAAVSVIKKKKTI